jgi:hypothetical protein
LAAKLEEFLTRGPRAAAPSHFRRIASTKAIILFKYPGALHASVWSQRLGCSQEKVTAMMPARASEPELLFVRWTQDPVSGWAKDWLQDSPRESE